MKITGDNMKIKLSKSQWEEMGKIAGWTKTAWDENYDYDSPEAENSRWEFKMAAEELAEEGIENPTSQQIEEKINSWVKMQEIQEAKKTVKFILDRYDYDANKIRQALLQEERRLKKLTNKEDWDAEFSPTSQGSMDAQDFKTDSIQEQSSIVAELNRALELLNPQVLSEETTAATIKSIKVISKKSNMKAKASGKKWVK